MIVLEYSNQANGECRAPGMLMVSSNCSSDSSLADDSVSRIHYSYRREQGKEMAKKNGIVQRAPTTVANSVRTHDLL